MNRFFTLFLAASCLTAVGQYEVGDVGPAGGWVFYVDEEDQFEDWDYLEAWPHTFSFFQLLVCDYSPYLSSPELGTGENNTSVFASNDDTFNAFDFTVLFDGGGRKDWFLPSKSELEALNASTVSALINSGEGYSSVSSSVFAGCQWWTFDINNGWHHETDLYSWVWVLPIRSFKTADEGNICGEGTIWDSMSSNCVVTNPSDSNFDGCVQLNDLLDLLGVYGDCAAEESAWQCGDPLEYQGYDYQTVQIGEQCWFAENLRSENYENGDAIPSNLSDGEWVSTTFGAVAVYGEGSSTCDPLSPDGDACDESWSLDEYGRLYNWYAVDDARALCPSGWHVPTDGQWTVMADYLGGAGVAGDLKAGYGWYGGGNGTNASGFSGLPGGIRGLSGDFSNAGLAGIWWSSSPNGSSAWNRNLFFDVESFSRGNGSLRGGFSVRCIQDVE